MTLKQLAQWSQTQGRQCDATKHVLLRLADGTSYELGSCEVEKGRLVLRAKGIVEVAEGKVQSIHRIQIPKPVSVSD